MSVIFFVRDFAMKVWSVFLDQNTHADFSVLPIQNCTRNLTVARRVLWKLLAQTVLWVLLSQRNSRLFDDQYCPVEKLVLKVKEQSWQWALLENVVKNVRLENIIFDWDRVVYC